MKNLITILFLFPLVLNAQWYIDTTDHLAYDSGWIETNLNWEQEMKLDLSGYFLEILIDVLDEYEQDCYNDSTLQHIDQSYSYYLGCYQKMGNLADGYYLELICTIPYHFKYVHKQPTFVDFMVWIKNRYK